MKNSIYLLVVIIPIAASLFIGVNTALAECGNIIYNEEGYDFETGTVTVVEVSEPIEDCDNPFGGVVETVPDLIYKNELLAPEVDILVSANEWGLFADTPTLHDYFMSLYKKVGQDYFFVRNISAGDYGSTLNNGLYTDAQILQLENQFFFDVKGETTNWRNYQRTNPGNSIPDYAILLISEFEFEFAPRAHIFTKGDYVLVLESNLGGPVLSFFDKLKNFILPTAYANDLGLPSIIPFTVNGGAEVAPPELAGASSVLFLPGIQASLLYKKGFANSEDQVWPPNSLFNNDVRDLRMNTEGVSENEIYTSGAISTTAGVGDVYASFQEYLTELQFEGMIENWTPFAYDWRYSVTDIAENGTLYKEGIRLVIDEIEYLASSSYSGKVTIIGHSNGGLLAKAIMNELEAQNKTNLIDTVVFLASPQLGTPKAIGTVLHGYDQTDKLGGIIINGQTAREVINNMPGAYGLLPSEKYFEGLNEPLITFTNNVTTEPYRSVYGDSLDTFDEYLSFVRGEDSFERDLDEDISIPVRANGNMLDQALAMHENELDNWVAPDGVKVIEVVGTGLPTMKSVEYREITEQKCASAGPAGQACVTESEMKPYAVLTKYGDGTVVQRSAEAYEGDKEKYFVNLKEFNNFSKNTGKNPSYHYNITETSPVQDLITDILLSTTTEENQFISTSHTEFIDEYDVEMIDSPVRLLATDEDGNETGVVMVDGVRVIKEEIPGSQYFEFGNTKYFIVPKGTDRTTMLYGEDYGGYTLTIAALDADNEQIIQTVLENASTTPDLVAEYESKDGVFSTITTDFNGDGVIDYETTMDGDVIEDEVTITYESLLEKVKTLDLSKKRERVLMVLIKQAHRYSDKATSRKIYARLEDKFLNLSSKLIRLYERRGFISETDGDGLLDMIKFLKDKQ